MTAEAIQPYRDKFFALAVKITELLGGVKSVTTEFVDLLLPEQLEISGFHGMKQVRGSNAHEDIIVAHRGEGRAAETLVLKQGNSSFPWLPLRRITCDATSADHLRSLLYF